MHPNAHTTFLLLLNKKMRISNLCQEQKKKEFEKNSGKLKFTQGSIGLSGKIF